jgi:hypothetical protein
MTWYCGRHCESIIRRSLRSKGEGTIYVEDMCPSAPRICTWSFITFHIEDFHQKSYGDFQLFWFATKPALSKVIDGQLRICHRPKVFIKCSRNFIRSDVHLMLFRYVDVSTDCKAYFFMKTVNRLYNETHIALTGHFDLQLYAHVTSLLYVRSKNGLLHL